MTGITYPSGDLVGVTRTTDGLVTGMTFTPTGKPLQAVVSSVTYELLYGPLASLSYANGLNLTRTYDQDYRLTGIETAPTTGAPALNESFAWQADGRVAGVTDNLVPVMGPTSRTASYGYTPSGRVMSGNGPWGNLAYGYDPSGNLTANGGTTMTVSPTSNQVTAVGGTVSRALTYLAGGELTGDAQTGRGALAYSCNAAWRMACR